MAKTLKEVMQETRTRIIAMQELAIPAAKSFDYSTSTGGVFDLYWTNFVAGTPVPQALANAYLWRIPFTARLISESADAGVITAATEEAFTYDHIPTVVQYFYERRNLVYQAGQRSIDFWHEEAFICTSSPYQTQVRVNNQGQASAKLGFATFTLTAPFQIPITNRIEG